MAQIKVLLVEDERLMALDLQEKLEDMGFIVAAVAGSAEEAFSLTDKTRPDLVLMDIMIEGDVDGIETAKRIRGSYNIPFIYISALTDEETMQRAKFSEPFAYLIKPFDDRELKFSIETAVYRHQLERRLSARLRFEEGLAKASQWLLADIDPMEAVAKTLGYLLTASGVSRVYLCENIDAPDDGLCFRQVREVCAAGVVSQAENPALQHFPYKKAGNFFLEKLRKGEAFQGNSGKMPAGSSRIFKIKGVRALLILPVHVGGRFWGFIGFDDVASPHQWSEEDVRPLRTAADMISAYMERWQAEEKLRESEGKYRQLIEGLNEAVYRMTLPESTYEYLSPAARNVFGYNSDEFMKNPSLLKEILHPDFVDSFEDIRVEMCEGIVPPSWEYKVVDPQKKERWIFQSHKGIFDSKGNIKAVEGICRDITKRKILENQLRKIAREWFSTFDSINDPIALIDVEKKIVRCNKAVSKLVGKPFSALTGREICELIHGSRPSPENCLVTQMKESRQRESRTMNIGERWFNVSVDPIFDDSGKLSGAVHIMNDISEQKKAEDTLREQQEKLLQADKMISLGILVSGMAHEINNPNNSIALNTQFLQKAYSSIIPILDEYYSRNQSLTIGGIRYNKFKDKVPSLFSGISESSKRIRHIVEDLKSFSRKNSTDIKNPVDINTVIQSAINLIKNLIKKSTSNFSVTYGRDLPYVRGNFQSLEQVVINLIQNACQALTSPEQGMSIRTHIESKNRLLTISVSDEGVGISPENLKYITEPFFTTRRTSGGTGLGLSVSAKIVADHNAALHFTSTPGEGTCARVQFRIERKESRKKTRRHND